MSKRYAILTQTRQAEAFRVGLGLTLLDDTVEVFVLGVDLMQDNNTQEQVAQLREMDIPLHLVPCDDPQTAQSLLLFDRVIPFL